MAALFFKRGHGTLDVECFVKKPSCTALGLRGQIPSAERSAVCLALRRFVHLFPGFFKTACCRVLASGRQLLFELTLGLRRLERKATGQLALEISRACPCSMQSPQQGSPPDSTWKRPRAQECLDGGRSDGAPVIQPTVRNTVVSHLTARCDAQ